MDKTESISYFLADNRVNFKFIFHTLAQMLARFEERESYLNKNYFAFNPTVINDDPDQAEAWLDRIFSAAELLAAYIEMIGFANPELQEKIESSEVNVLLVEPQSLAEVIALGTDFDIQRKNITVLTSKKQLIDDYTKHIESLPLEIDGINLEFYQGSLGQAITERSAFVDDGYYDLVIADKARLEVVVVLLQELLRGKLLTAQGALVFRTFHKLRDWSIAKRAFIEEWDEAGVLEALFSVLEKQQCIVSSLSETPRKGFLYAHLQKQLPPVDHNGVIFGNPSAHAIVSMFDSNRP